MENEMNTAKKILLTSLFALPLMVSAGEANVTFGDLKEFRDVKPANETRGGYHKRVQKQFEKHFQKQAEQLPDGYKLGIKVTDIDLAGDVRFGQTEMRVVKPIYFPRIDFSYVLTDSKGKLVDKGEVSLKDMGFMDKIRRGRDEEFMHDKRLVTEWFDNDLLPKVK